MLVNSNVSVIPRKTSNNLSKYFVQKAYILPRTLEGLEINPATRVTGNAVGFQIKLQIRLQLHTRAALPT